MEHAWAENTSSSYSVYARKWNSYMEAQNINKPCFKDAHNFLAKLFNSEQAKYGKAAVARSALSAILPPEEGFTFGNHPDTKKLMKAIFRRRPTIPKHTVIYDPDVILNHINSLPNNKQLLLDTPTSKLCTLFALVSGQRSQSLATVDTSFIDRNNHLYTIYYPSAIKTTQPKFHQKPIEIKHYPIANLCLNSCIDEYLSRTENIRENLPKDIVNPNSLVLSPHYPHYPVKSGTIAKYVAKLITSSGIELKQFSAHSTRSSTTSKATELGMSIKDICKGAGWKSENTFRKFYQLPIHKANNFQIILDQL